MQRTTARGRASDFSTFEVERRKKLSTVSFDVGLRSTAHLYMYESSLKFGITACGIHETFWIAATNIIDPANYEWSYGTRDYLRDGYTNWFPGEPYGYGGDDCAAKGVHGPDDNYQWFDEFCIGDNVPRYGYMCKAEQVLEVDFDCE